MLQWVDDSFDHKEKKVSQRKGKKVFLGHVFYYHANLLLIDKKNPRVLQTYEKT